MPTRRFRQARLQFVALHIVLLLVSPSITFGQESFESLARQATAARELGKPNDAIRYYQQALKIHPEWDEGWWYLGSLLYDSNHFAEAIPAFSKVAELDPKLGPAWSFLGLCDFETKDYPNALAHLEKGQELGSAGVPEIAKVADYHVALLLIRNGEFERATALLSSEFVQGQVSDQAKVALGLALLRVPFLPDQVDPSKDAVIATAGSIAVLLAQNQQEQAFQAFQQALKDYSEIPYLHYAYGLALAAAGRFDEAQVQLREETRISPQSALPYQALAESLRAAGKANEAASAQRKLEELGTVQRQESARIAQRYARDNGAGTRGSGQAKSDVAANQPGSGSAGFEQTAKRAVAARDAGHVEEAIRNYNDALQMRPTWAEGWFDLSVIYVSNARYADAIAPLKHVVDLKPGFGTAWAMLGLSEYETKDYRNALIHLEKAQGLGLQGSPEAIRLAQYHLAVLLNQDRQFERAVDLLSGGHPEPALAALWNLALGMGLLRVAVFPEQVQVSQQALLVAAGQVASLLANSKYDEAFAILQKLLKDYPNTPFLHYVYGSALASLSQYDEAESQLREEMRISPESALPYIRGAFIALKTRHPGDALADAQRAVQLAPQSAEAHYILGRAWLDSGDPQQAIKELEVANGMMPNSPEIHFHLARAYSKAKQPQKAEQERQIFTGLNALAERQRSQRGSQAYGASHEQSDLSLPAVAVTTEAATDSR
jgi:tetratricopeptide (TPR) repeat protein